MKRTLYTTIGYNLKDGEPNLLTVLHDQETNLRYIVFDPSNWNLRELYSLPESPGGKAIIQEEWDNSFIPHLITSTALPYKVDPVSYTLTDLDDIKLGSGEPCNCVICQMRFIWEKAKNESAANNP